MYNTGHILNNIVISLYSDQLTNYNWTSFGDLPKKKRSLCLEWCFSTAFSLSLGDFLDIVFPVAPSMKF